MYLQRARLSKTVIEFHCVIREIESKECRAFNGRRLLFSLAIVEVLIEAR